MANTEKTIIDIQPINFFKRFFLKECLMYFILLSILLFIPINFIANFIIWLLTSSFFSITAIGMYCYYTYRIRVVDNEIVIDYVYFTKEKQIRFDLKTINIDFTKGSYFRSIFDVIAFRKTYDHLFRITPELRFAKFWTEEKIEDVYKLLKEAQDEAKQSSE